MAEQIDPLTAEALEKLHKRLRSDTSAIDRFLHHHHERLKADRELTKWLNKRRQKPRPQDSVDGAPLAPPIKTPTDAWFEAKMTQLALTVPHPGIWDVGAAPKDGADAKLMRLIAAEAIDMSAIFLWKTNIFENEVKTMPLPEAKPKVPLGMSFHTFEGAVPFASADRSEMTLVDSILVAAVAESSMGPQKAYTIGQPMDPVTKQVRVGMVLRVMPLSAPVIVRMHAFLNTRLPRLARASEAYPSKKHIKRATSRGVEVDRISVITLRAHEDPGAWEGTPTGHELQYRQLVSGHWKRVHTRDGIETRWIDQYERGPEDGPLRPQIRVVSR